MARRFPFEDQGQPLPLCRRRLRQRAGHRRQRVGGTGPPVVEGDENPPQRPIEIDRTDQGIRRDPLHEGPVQGFVAVPKNINGPLLG